MGDALYFAGDTHSEHGHLVEFLREYPYAQLIHVGDIELNRLADDEFPDDVRDRLWWIHGNHDYDRQDRWAHLYQPEMMSRCLHGRVVEIQGVRVAGLGGNFQGSVWMPPDQPNHETREALSQVTPRQNRHPTYGVALKRAGAIWKEDFDALAPQSADILVTHEAPSTHRNGFSETDELGQAMGVHTIVHGHHHVDYKHQPPAGTQVLGVGFRAIASVETGGIHQVDWVVESSMSKRNAN